METKIQKWGNSLAIRLPKTFADQTGIENGSDVHLLVEEGKIVIIPIKEKELLLEDFLSRINEANIHKEISFGSAFGRESL